MLVKMFARTDKFLKNDEATFEVQQRRQKHYKDTLHLFILDPTELLAERIRLFVASESHAEDVEVLGTQVTLSYNDDNGRFEVLDEDGEVISWNDSARDFVDSAAFIISNLA